MQLARYMTLLLSPLAESERSPSPSRSDPEPPPALSQPRRASPLRQLLLPLLLLLWLRPAKPLGAGSHAESPVTRSLTGKFLYSVFFVLSFLSLIFSYTCLVVFSAAPL